MDPLLDKILYKVMDFIKAPEYTRFDPISKSVKAKNYFCPSRLGNLARPWSVGHINERVNSFFWA